MDKTSDPAQQATRSESAFKPPSLADRSCTCFICFLFRIYGKIKPRMQATTALSGGTYKRRGQDCKIKVLDVLFWGRTGLFKCSLCMV
jgi:hypothetical protein